MDKYLGRIIVQEIKEALVQVAANRNVTFESLGFQYTGTSFIVKLECAEVAPDGKAQTKDRMTFETYAPTFGLSPKDLDEEFISGGERYIITGLNLKARRFPIQVKRVRDGKGFKFGAFVVESALKAQGVKV